VEQLVANQLSFKSGLVAIIRTKTADEARAAAIALISSGVDVIEFTTTTPAVFDLIEEFSSDTSNSGVHVGLGTAMSRSHVLSGKDAGAKFVISPHVSQEVIETTKQAGLISIPGVASPTEVADAMRYGADILKFFPASALGPNYLKAVCEPFPGLSWMATGGISVETIPDWIAAGVTGFGVGGKLISGGVAEIPNRVAEFKRAIAAARGE
jgi:2-dehydro-3-deoxyphosphogluconate aldolase/(4S)-4-hydroxy-2-oxoglutarate aldolase